MARIIEARVIQKIDTEQNWNANELILYKGEIALVGDTDRVYNIKVGNGVKKFRDLPYMVNYVNGLYTGIITPQSQVPSGVNNVFLVSEQGTYTNFGGVVLPKDNLGIIYKNGNNYTIQLIPIVSEEKLQKYIDEKLVDINVGFGGEITSLNQSPNVQGMYIPKANGVYPNFGNLEYNSVEGFTLFLYKDGQFSKIVVPLNSVESDVNFNNNILGVSGSAVEKYAVKKVNNVTELRGVDGEYEGQIITLLGYYDKGDKEPLNYKWTNTKDVDDGGSVINSENGSWLAIFDTNVNIKHFGSKTDIDNTDIIQKLIDLNLNIYIDNMYQVNGTLVIRKNTSIIGKSISNPKWTDGYSGIIHKPLNVLTDLFVTDVEQSGYGYLAGINMENLTIKGSSNSRYCFNLKNVANSSFKYIYTDTFVSALYNDYSMNIEFLMCNFAENSDACVRFVGGISTTTVFDKCYLHFSKWGAVLEHETSLGITFRDTIVESCTDGGYDIHTDNIVDFISAYAENIPRTPSPNIPIVQIGVNGVEKNNGYPTAKVSFVGGNLAGCNFGIDEDSVSIKIDKVAYVSFNGVSINRANRLIDTSINTKLVSFNDTSFFEISDLFKGVTNRDKVSFNRYNYINSPELISEHKTYSFLGSSKWSLLDQFVRTNSDLVLRKGDDIVHLINNLKSHLWGGDGSTGDATNVHRFFKTNDNFNNATYNDSAYLYSKSDNNGLVHMTTRDSAGVETIIDGVLAVNTSERPIYNFIGKQIFDKQLNKPLWWNGASWVDSSGVSV